MTISSFIFELCLSIDYAIVIDYEYVIAFDYVLGFFLWQHDIMTGI